MPTPASPGMNQYRCDACGRYFNTDEELKLHRHSCMEARQTGAVRKKKVAHARDEGPDREWVSTP